MKQWTILQPVNRAKRGTDRYLFLRIVLFLFKIICIMSDAFITVWYVKVNVHRKNEETLDFYRRQEYLLYEFRYLDSCFQKLKYSISTFYRLVFHAFMKN